jgi:aminoglycoside phosphotransferase
MLGILPINARLLSGGMIGDVYRIELADGRVVVAKVSDTADASLSLEDYMLRYLAEHSHLPVLQVLQRRYVVDDDLH